jgi:putative tryptophan/tyrosine transport system substrate-binding protein
MLCAMRKAAVFSVLFVLVPLAVAVIAEAQQTKKVPRIGYLSPLDAASDSTQSEAFRLALRELGYVERKNIIVEFRYAEEKLDRLPDLAKELVGLNVDVIVTAGGTSTRYAKEATGTIPIVMVQDNDPVGNGFVASLGRPGGNITGLATLAPEISGKRLELLREIVPKLSRIAVLGASSNPGNAQSLKETELAGRQFGLQLKYFDVRNLKDIENGFQDAEKERTDAVLLLVSSVLNSYRTQVVGLATKNRVPAIYPFIDFVEAGGLMSYGVSFIDLHRRAANYVDKILKGSKPADLPVEQATKFELVINTKAAKQIGLTIPPNALARADKVIK